MPPTAKAVRTSKSGGVAKLPDFTGEVVVNPASQGNKGGLGGPKRPVPPGKPNKLAELYRGGGSEELGTIKKGGEASDVGVVKDKGELQASIRSLKENNEALIDINKNLEQKLFKVC